MIIHSGLFPEWRNASTIFRRFASFLCLMSESVSAISARKEVSSFSRSRPFNSSRIASAPIMAVKESCPNSSCAQIFLFRKELAVLQRCQAGLEHHVIFKIEDPLEILQRHVEQQADAGRQRLQEPDVRHGSSEFDMAHTLAPHARQRHLDRALLADDALVLHPLVLAAQALVILDRPEDARAEQTVTFRLEGAVIDGLRLLDLAVGPGQDFLRRRSEEP